MKRKYLISKKDNTFLIHLHTYYNDYCYLQKIVHYFFKNDIQHESNVGIQIQLLALVMCIMK